MGHETFRNAPFGLRFEPTAKTGLSLIAVRERLSMASMMERLIRKHCKKESLG
jgi:hypothetical protein